MFIIGIVLLLLALGLASIGYWDVYYKISPKCELVARIVVVGIAITGITLIIISLNLMISNPIYG